MAGHSPSSLPPLWSEMRAWCGSLPHSTPLRVLGRRSRGRSPRPYGAPHHKGEGNEGEVSRTQRFHTARFQSSHHSFLGVGEPGVEGRHSPVPRAAMRVASLPTPGSPPKGGREWWTSH